MRPADPLESRCARLRSLHRPGAPLVLPNVWDVATARAVTAAGFPVVATTSGGVAAALGYDDHEGAPAAEMFAAASRISRGVSVPATIDAEAGYGMEPAELVAALKRAGAAGCNLEDTDHARGTLRDPARQADWLRAVRVAAFDQDYGLVINARIDVFLSAVISGADRGSQEGLVPEALQRARAYFEAGVDCVFPIALWERDALAAFVSNAAGPVNALALARAPSRSDSPASAWRGSASGACCWTSERAARLRRSQPELLGERAPDQGQQPAARRLRHGLPAQARQQVLRLRRGQRVTGVHRGRGPNARRRADRRSVNRRRASPGHLRRARDRLCGPAAGRLITVGATRVSCRIARRVATELVRGDRPFRRWRCPGARGRA